MSDFETLTYRVSFGEADSGGRQALRLHALTGAQAREDSAAGVLVLEGRTGETATAHGTRFWAGRTADSFYIDLSLLAIVNGAVASGTAPDRSVWQPQGAQNSFAGPSPGYGEAPWRSASRTISTRPFAPSLLRMREM